MADALLPPTEAKRVLRIRRETRWIIAVLEGIGAGAFVACLFRDSPPGAAASFEFVVAAAFLIGSVVAFLLWPMVSKDRSFEYDCGAAFGALVVLLTSHVWTLVFVCASPVTFAAATS